jgi:hypothetical protein
MAIQNRRFTYRGKIKISSEDMHLVELGKKRCTIRLGEIDVEGAQIRLTDGQKSVAVRICKIKKGIPFSEINDEDIQAEGLENRLALENDLKKFYGPIEASQQISVIYFEPI